MKAIIRQRLKKGQSGITRRLSGARRRQDTGRPVLRQTSLTYELSERTRGLSHGGLGAVQALVLKSGLVAAIDEHVRVLKAHRPYHESDHVLNLAYNAFCGGRTLDDIEHRRRDEAHLDLLGVDAIPGPTTAGDFCRRFEPQDIENLQRAINETRLSVWAQQGPAFTQETARIDADGSFVTTASECKEGIALSYKGTWGYHPLLVSLANTGEPLFLANRSGNRPSSEGAAHYLDRAIALCRRAGFQDILLRGDTDFSQTRHLDGWDQGGVRFVFGYDAHKPLRNAANELGASTYRRLLRKADAAFRGRKRARRPRLKEEFVRFKGYRNIRLCSEDVAEFDYKPGACKKTYRVVVLRKNLSIERGERVLFDDIRYFFYITNDRTMTAPQVVAEAAGRCNQENLIAQLKGGVRALHAPVNTLEANWAYMVMTALAWTLKAWMALSLPIAPRWREKHEAERDRWLRMEFRTFLQNVIHVPAQILRSGRRHIVRLLAWKPQLHVFFRLLDAL